MTDEKTCAYALPPHRLPMAAAVGTGERDLDALPDVGREAVAATLPTGSGQDRFSALSEIIVITYYLFFLC